MGSVTVRAQSRELWAQVYESFKWHVNAFTDSGPQDTLNRIAAKCMTKKADAVATRSFDPSNCFLREARLSPEQLTQLDRYHERRVPQFEVEPVVVLRYEGRGIVIEGNTRVNKWCAEGGSRLRSVIFIEPR